MNSMLIGLVGSSMALSVFVMVNSITPGPNNLMLLQGGLTRKFWACRFNILGISFGMGVMLWLSYWGMSSVVVDHPNVMLGIKILGSAYLIWLAHKMAKTDFIAVVQSALQIEVKDKAVARQRFADLPLSFWEAAALQWLNPKAWTMTMVAPSLAMIHSGRAWLDNWPLLVLCMVINIACISCWAAGGQWLRKLVHHPRLMKSVHALIVVMVLYCALALWL